MADRFSKEIQHPLQAKFELAQEKAHEYVPSPRDVAFAGTKYKRGYTRHAPQEAYLGQDNDTREQRWKRFHDRAQKYKQGIRDEKSLWHAPATHQERTIEENIRQRKGKSFDPHLADEGRRRASEWNVITSGGLQKSETAVGKSLAYLGEVSKGNSPIPRGDLIEEEMILRRRFLPKSKTKAVESPSQTGVFYDPNDGYGGIGELNSRKLFKPPRGRVVRVQKDEYMVRGEPFEHQEPPRKRFLRKPVPGKKSTLTPIEWRGRYNGRRAYWNADLSDPTMNDPNNAFYSHKVDRFTIPKHKDVYVTEDYRGKQ